MEFAPRCLLLACLLGVVGCALPTSTQRRAGLEDRMQADTDQRKARLQTASTLSPQEYALMARKMGWTTDPAGGLPAAPSITELERRVKAAEAKP